MRLSVVLLGLAALAPVLVAQAPPDGGAWWSSWRGPEGTGVARQGNPPIEWSETENVRWKVAVPGLGNSSPVIWGDRVFVMTAIDTGRTADATARQPQDRRAEPIPTSVYEFVVLALNRKDGSVAWRTEVTETVPHEGGHATNSHASSSPVTDGEHVYANFGSRGLYCLDMRGEIQWSVDLGTMLTRYQYGEGSSPVLHGNTLIINWDHEGDSFIHALDKRNGEEIWRRERDEMTSWSTPIIVEVNGRPQVVINATAASRGYDLEDGEVLWSLPGMSANCIPSPAYADGVAYLMSGFRANNLQAVRLAGASGELEGSEAVLWTHKRRTSYVPSALLYDGYYYFIQSNNGVLSCLDARNGDVYYEGERLRRMRSVYASPVGVDGRVYITSREGRTNVLALGPEFKELATNQLDDGFDASAAIAGDELYLRGREHLYCIAR